MQDLVRRSFASEYAGFLMNTKNVNHVEVCGDICAYFTWRGDPNDESVWRFIVLRELSDGPGSDVSTFTQNVRAIKAIDLLDKRFCRVTGSDTSGLSCEWEAYSKALGVTAGHVRYDEGNRCYSQTTNWATNASSEWKCSPMKPSESPYHK
jgi:hypothetical protein